MENAPLFDVVVVGSGFGGSVMTHELASRGLRVCLLERGKKYAPGEFARSPYQMRNNLWNPSAGLHGMFNIWQFQGLNSIVASGLGGGSLVYANVLLAKPESWFESDQWPLRYADLASYYERAKQLLGGHRFPFDVSPYSDTPRARLFQQAIEQAATNLGAELTWEDILLSVSFADEHDRTAPGLLLDDGRRNLHGRPRVTCQLCGECNFGCNYGAKNTLDYTCLSGLPEDRVKIMTRCEVRSFEPIERPDGTIAGYRITYVDHSDAIEGVPRATHDPNELLLQEIIAPQLVLAAGSLGTTFLMLRMQRDGDALRELSPALGSRFSGNGDRLTFAVRRRNGQGGAGALIDGSYGPAITSCAGFLKGLPATADGSSGRGFFIQDAGYPHAANWLLHLSIGNIIRTIGENALEIARFLGRGLFEGNDTDVSAELANILQRLDEEEWIPLLGIGQDTPNGRILLDGRLADVDWQERGSQAYYDDLRKVMGAIAQAMEARLVEKLPGPLGHVVTVHPLGGCPMGRDADEGVVDLYGEVFRGERRYNGLFIADGSIMPGPVGANPSLTIAATALRIAEKVYENYKHGQQSGS